MKLSTFFLALAAVGPTAFAEQGNLDSLQDFSVAAVASTEHRELASLAEVWNLTDPTFNYDSLSFNLTFTMSDAMINTPANNDTQDNTRVSLWTAPDCQEGGTRLNATHSLTLTEDDVYTPHSTRGSGDNQGREATVNIAIDPMTISSETDLGIYSEGGGADLAATITFCVRFGLWTANTPGDEVEVNFLETIITLTADLSDGFEIGQITVEPKDKLIRTANQVYEVEAWECSYGSSANHSVLADFTELTGLGARQQGSVFTVCVLPDDTAQGDDIYMRGIESFTFKRTSPILVEQVAIESRNTAAGNLLTTVACASGYLVCSFSTILFADFYTSLGTVNGEGSATLQFGTTTQTRRLREGGRQAQEDDVAAAAEFDLEFGVAQADDTFSGASSMGVMFTSLVALMGVAAMF